MMRKLSKKAKIMIGVVLLIIVLIGSWTGYRIHQQQEELRMEQEAELELIYTYMRLHYAFAMMGHPEEIPQSGEVRERLHRLHGSYRELNPNAINAHGIDAISYLLTKFYYGHTGIYLSYDLVMDYFSEEFEPDGSLRLYNNGKHPEIEAFVTWVWENRKREVFSEYLDRLDSMHVNYFLEHREQGFGFQGFHDLSPQMIDALVRAEANPDYELDLTSLQEAGY